MINWDKPKKVRTTEEHNKMYSSDSGIPGTYVPNMSEEDLYSWRGKLVGQRTGFPHVELRKAFTADVLIYVSLGEGFKISKYEGPDQTKGINVRISSNAAISLTFEELQELNLVIEEAKEKLKNEFRSET